MNIKETIDSAHRFLDESQWEDRYSSRYDETTRSCRACSARASDQHRDALHHDDDCTLIETLRELDTISVTLQAKEDAGEDPAIDPIEECSRMWASRVREQERGLRAKAQAAEQRATQAERRLAELVRAAREFGYADARFREILNNNGVTT